ncbi:hypothetical protein CAEBREN_22438 [Caenorhabditis brenneri]|uniref:Uncharacterized protein n=1 Tax=Caenorhabditis brenneri TaxID=135651 RepID=G0P4F6_CAEBE|nr:hypothetical protein CAEBREN_22438 [Caenorhabditis brenneri]
MDATHFYEPKKSWVQIAERWKECGVGVTKDEEIRKEDLGKCLLWLDIGPVTKKSVGPEPKNPAQRGARAVTTGRIKKGVKKRSERRTRHQILDHPAQFVTAPIPHNHRNTIKIEIEAPGYKDTPYHYDPQLDHLDTSMPILSPYPGAYEAITAAPQINPIVFEAHPGFHQNSFAETSGLFPTQNAPLFEPTIFEAHPPTHQNHFPIFDECMVPYVEEEVTIALEENNSKEQAAQSNSIPPFLRDLGIDLGVYLYDPQSLEPAPQFKRRPGNSYNLYRAQWRKLGKIPVISFRKLPDEEWRLLEKAKVTLDELQKDQIKKGLIRIEGPRKSRMMVKMESN